MRIITIDTATERSLVALIENGQVIAHQHLPFGLMQSQTVAPVLDRLLKAHEWPMSTIGAIAVSAGPGSYTGIRVGVALAKTLSFSLKVPLIGWCALEGFIPEEDGQFAVVVDAKIAGAFVRIGEKKGENVSWIGEVEAIPLTEFPDRLGKIKTFVTPSQGGIQSRLGEKKNLWKWEEKGPDPDQVARVVGAEWGAGRYSTEGKVEILYLRKTEAEINLEKKGDLP